LTNLRTDFNHHSFLFCMLTSFLFLIASLVVITFIIVKILNPSEGRKLSTQELLQQFDPEKDWNAGAFLLKIGPVIAGFGLVGWIATEWWDQPETRLLLITLLTVILYGIGGFLYVLSKKNNSLLVLGEASLLIASFMLGGALYSANEFFELRTGGVLFGVAELFGIWFAVNLFVAYVARSTWTFGVNVFVAIFWLAGYLNPRYNFAWLIGIRDTQVFSSDTNYLSLLIPSIVVVATTCFYAWHQKNEHNNPKSEWRAFYYLSGLFSYLIVGALIFRSIDLYYSEISKAGELDFNGTVLNDLLIAIIALLAFAFDFVLKRLVKNYNINYLVAVLVPITAFISAVAFPNAIFAGFFFIEVPFIVWILADYLREKSSLAAPIFYAFNAIQLFVLAIDQNDFNWFKILVILGILMYAAVLHYLNRPFVVYVMIVGILTLMTKVLATGANGFLIIVMAGCVLMAFGVFYTQTRAHMIRHRKELGINQ